jgi:expansin (peptidoglycan-binding protein)
MKSFGFMMPLVGLALAQQQCDSQKTITKTEVQKITVTVPAASAIAADVTADTSIKPTHRPQPHHSYHPVPHYPLPNGTYHNTSTLASNTAPHPTTLLTLSSVLLPSSEHSSTSIKTLYVVPSPVDAPSKDATDAATQTAAIPASETAAAASSTAASPAETPAPETSPAETVNAAATVSGQATSYGGNLAGGTCMFDGGYTIPSGLFGTAFSGQGWDASKCGVCVSVKGPNGKPVKAMVRFHPPQTQNHLLTNMCEKIVDKCPECAPSHLDLFADAFTAVSGQSPGIIDISYSIVPCGITTPLILKNKAGTSPYWFSMQVENANVGVAKLEVSIDGGKSWKGTTRKDYNFFENPAGFGTQTVDVKVTSVNGGVVTVKGVGVTPNAQVKAGSNFA